MGHALDHGDPLDNEGWGIAVQPLRVGYSPTTRGMMLMLIGAATFILLIACANVANLHLFVRQGMTMTCVGIAVGLAGAWALARVARGLLHDVSPTDPLSFAGVALLLIAVSFLATYVPARRAADVDPLIAIRD